MELISEIERLTAVVAALGALAIGIINARKISQVHISINSRMEQLLTQTALASKAEGASQERVEEAVRKADAK